MLSAVYTRGVQPVICQVFFIFFVKSQLLLAFYIIAVGVSLRSGASRRRWVQQFRSEAARPFTEERKHFFRSYMICCMQFFTCVLRVSSLRGVSVVCECWQVQYGTLQQWVHWQAADELGGSACHARAGLNWWPHPTRLPVYLCRGQTCVTAREYLACLNKLRFAHWLMENQWRRLVLPLIDVPFGRQCCVSRRTFALSTGPLCRFLNYHDCFYSSWEHSQVTFLGLLHILGRDLDSVFVCVEPLQREKLARTGWLSKRSQTPSPCFWVSDFRPTLPLSLCFYLSVGLGLFRQATLCQQPHITPMQAWVRWRAPAWLMWSDG